MNRAAVAKITLLTLLVLFAAPTVSVAQQNRLPGQIVPCDGTSAGGGTECTVCHLATLAQNILNTAIYLAVFLSAFLFAWAGWTYMTAMGDTHKTTKARNAFRHVALGLVVILIGWLVVDILLRTLMGSGPGMPWNSIC